MNLPLKQGDIHFGQQGDDPAQRPMVILSREEMNAVRENVVVALITTRIRRIPTEIPVGPAESLPQEAVISLADIHTIPKSRLSAKTGTLSPSKMTQLRAALKLVFALTP